MDVRLTEIVMQFPGTRALDGVSVQFRDDEVHGLIGENGAGKSTLVNILGGSLHTAAATKLSTDTDARPAACSAALRRERAARRLPRSTCMSAVSWGIVRADSARRRAMVRRRRLLGRASHGKVS